MIAANLYVCIMFLSAKRLYFNAFVTMEHWCESHCQWLDKKAS